MSGFLWLVGVLLALFLFARWFGGMGIGAPWLPVRKQDMEAAFKLVSVGAQDVVVDLGSGDGRLLAESAKRGARAIGYELNPFMVWVSRARLKKYSRRAEVYRRNLLEADLKEVTVVFVFGMEWIMPLISEKLKREAKRDVRIVSFAFALPGLVEEKKEGIARLYRLPD
ncbi:class I SAM-dependent methyltransferase [Patescibacteria group bacterium]|jgi:SAM-dependent methyltransferase|nr:class I SAM-dependent methyltransferase [Patescibacteria group bacterium]